VAPPPRPRAFKPPVRKRFGQHFLERAWVPKLLEVIKPRPGERFLEIGPGAGQLTLPLARAGAHVVAVEIDRDLAERLRQVAPPAVQVISGDMLTQDTPALMAICDPDATGSLRVVGNLPYNLSSPMLFQLLGIHRTQGGIRDATLMLQAEVAERIIAVPGSRTYGPLSILTRLAADAERALSLPPGAFRPPPRVRSALVTFRFREAPVEIKDPALFEKMVRSLFTQRRKTLLNALGPFARTVSLRTPRELLESAGLASARRPETLDIADLAALADTLTAGPRPVVQ
jgi:16S rRNA (adenine1518-N6/adenine1519-N6)-dimethyltransferase